MISNHARERLIILQRAGAPVSPQDAAERDWAARNDGSLPPHVHRPGQALPDPAMGSHGTDDTA